MMEALLTDMMNKGDVYLVIVCITLNTEYYFLNGVMKWSTIDMTQGRTKYLFWWNTKLSLDAADEIGHKVKSSRKSVNILATS